MIKWEEVDDELIIELLIKYSHIILNDASLVNLFLEIYINKFRKTSDVELIIKKFFKAIKKLEYHQLFGKIKKDEKIIKIKTSMIEEKLLIMINVHKQNIFLKIMKKLEINHY